MATNIGFFNIGYALPTVVASGTITTTVDEDDITSTSHNLILTLTGGAWVSSGVTFDAQRQNIINGITSAQTETTGWNNEVRDNLAVTDVTRTSDQVVTISIPAQAAYDITAQETITVTVPASAVDGAAYEITGSPTFTVDIGSIACDITLGYINSNPVWAWFDTGTAWPVSDSSATFYFNGGATMIDFTTGLDIDYNGPGMHQKVFPNGVELRAHNFGYIFYGVQNGTIADYESLGFDNSDMCVVFANP